MNLKRLLDTPPWEWPQGTSAQLLLVLSDARSSEEDLLLAAELSGDFTVMNNDLASALLALVQGPGRSAELRGVAAIALGPVLEQADTAASDLDDVPISEEKVEEIKRALKQTHDDETAPTDVRRHSLEAAVRAPEDWQVEAIRQAYADENPAWKVTAVLCMSYVRGFDEQILEALDSKSSELRQNALLAAGNWEIDAAWPYVVALLKTQFDKPLLLAAIQASAGVRPDEAHPYLVELAESKDDEIAAAAQDALSVSGYEGEEREIDESLLN